MSIDSRVAFESRRRECELRERIGALQLVDRDLRCAGRAALGLVGDVGSGQRIGVLLNLSLGCRGRLARGGVRVGRESRESESEQHEQCRNRGGFLHFIFLFYFLFR